MKIAKLLGRLDLSVLDDVEPLHLQVGPVHVTLRCQEPVRTEMLKALAPAIVDHAAEETIRIDVLDGQMVADLPKLKDWARGPDRILGKDAYVDLKDGRLVRKVRTGMAFLQGDGFGVAFGPASANANQIANFVNAQILSAAHRAGWQIAHAAAVTDGFRGLAVSGLSGGGKSTTILRLMDIDGLSYVTNDRLLLRSATDCARGLGVPKMPRINPGTILGNPRLHGLLSPDRRDELQAMEMADLWPLEEKHDLDIDAVYGPGRVSLSADITHYWVLNWSHESEAPTKVRSVSLYDRPDLLDAIMKSPGVFHQKADGTFLSDDEEPDPSGYVQALRNVEIYEISGRIDFDALADAGRALFSSVEAE